MSQPRSCWFFSSSSRLLWSSRWLDQDRVQKRPNRRAPQFAEKVWDSKVLPVIQEKAQDIAMVVQEIRADPAAAGEKYGRRESTNPYSYMVKGSGKVLEVHTESQAGTLVLEVPGLNEKIALQIGPVVRGTALRDATGAAPFDQFTNQLDYADVSKEMNKRAVKAAFANVNPSSVTDKSITFFGAFTFDPRSKGTDFGDPGQGRAVIA